MKHILNILKLFLLAFLSAVLLSCSVQIVDRSSLKSYERMRGVYHRVKPGETLWRISKAYNVDLQELAEINNITDSSRISAGSVVFVPDAHEVIDIPPARPPVETKTAAPKPLEQPAAVATGPVDARPAAAAAGTTTGAAVIGGRSKVKEESISDRAPAPKPERSPSAAANPPEKTPPRPAEKPDTAASAAAKTQIAARPPAPVPAEKTQPRPAEKPDAAASAAANTQVAMKPPASAPPVKAPDTALKERAAVTPPPKKPEPAEPQGQIRVDKGRFTWPVRGPVITRFGIQPSGMKYNGIKIAAKENAPVQAAAAGTVIYASYVKGYGETVIVKHDENYTTVYAYLKNTVAKRDERIKKGEKIAAVGPSQEPGGEPYLYFEIREKNRARNPLFFLP
jgi:lipoprotein NlpD